MRFAIISHGLGTALLRSAALLVIALPIGAGAQTVPSASDSATATVSIALPRHTVIPVLIDKDIRVGGAGDNQQTKTIKIQVAQDVIVNGFLVAQKGDLAEGHLTTEKNATKRAFSKDVSQEAALDIDEVVNFCGDTIHMEFERTYVGGERAGFMSFGVHAHDAVFGKGSVLKAQSDRLEKSVCAQKTAVAPLPLPTNMIVPDEEVETK
ncbi:MAG TPA: hypothetical protein VGP41_15450 [Candidatus Lustribacter sp.]|nr:hypothetical protein [Candidatus Lustribacter sp.]